MLTKTLAMLKGILTRFITRSNCFSWSCLRMARMISCIGWCNSFSFARRKSRNPQNNQANESGQISMKFHTAFRFPFPPQQKTAVCSPHDCPIVANIILHVQLSL